MKNQLCLLTAVALSLQAAFAAPAQAPAKDRYESAVVLMGTNKVPQAQLILEQLCREQPKNVTYKTQLAHCLIAENNLPQALVVVEQAIALNPRIVDCHIMRGKILMTKHEFPMAVSAFDTALSLEPNSQDAMIGRASANCFLHNYNSALKDLNRVLVLNPKSFWAHSSLVFYYRSQGQSDKELEECNKALAAEPRNFQLLQRRGQLYCSQGLNDKGIEDFKRAEHCFVGDATDLYMSMAYAYFAKGQIKEAMLFSNKVLAKDPNRVQALNCRGYCYMLLGEVSKGIADIEKLTHLSNDENLMVSPTAANAALLKAFNRAIETNPRLYQLYSDRAEVELHLGQFGQAIRDCSFVIEHDVKPVSMHFTRLGICYSHQQKYAQAMAQFDRALAIDPNDTLAKAMLVKCRGRAYSSAETASRDYKTQGEGVLGQGLTALSQDVKQHPDEAAPLLRRANYYLKSLESDQAIKDYTEAIKIEPKLADVYVHRALAYRSIRKFANAFQDLKKALQIDPGNSEALLQSARLHTLLHQSKEALSDYDKLVSFGVKQAYQERAVLLMSMNSLEPSLSDANMAVKLHAGRDQLQIRADVYMKMGRYREAVEDYSTAVKLSPQDAPLYRMRAAAYRKLGEKQLALLDEQSSSKLDKELFELAPFRHGQ